MLLTKLGTPETVGGYSLGVAIATPIMMFANLHLRWILTTDIRMRYTAREYVGCRYSTTIAALLAIVAIAFGFRYTANQAALIVAIGVAQAVEALSDIYYAVLQRHDHMDRIAQSMILRAALSLGFMAAVLFSTGSVWLAVVSVTIARIVVLLLFDMRMRLEVGLEPSTTSAFAWLLPEWNVASHQSLLRTAFPMGIVALLLSLNTNVPRYFLEVSTGARGLGMFAAIAVLGSAGNLIVQALGQSAIVRLSRLYEAQRGREFYVLLSKLLAVGAVLGIGGIVAAVVLGQEVLTVLYRPEYAAHADLLVGLMIVAGIGYLAQFLGVAMTAARFLKPQLPLFLAVTATVTGCSAWLIPMSGLRGAVNALLITMVIQLVGTALVLLAGTRNVIGCRNAR